MVPSRQLGFGPMPLQQVASAAATQGNLVSAPSQAADQGISLVDAVVAASTHMGLQHDQLGSLFGGLSVSEVTKNFGPNNPDRNRLMKEKLPLAFAREVALALCEATGLAVAGPDVERHALADLLQACSQYVRVLSR